MTRSEDRWHPETTRTAAILLLFFASYFLTPISYFLSPNSSTKAPRRGSHGATLRGVELPVITSLSCLASYEAAHYSVRSRIQSVWNVSPRSLSTRSYVWAPK
ncbi:hypothetical protein Mal4_26570 [Maioricimonas rarisocia]|uniref:Uncharacterized protein n=1 Tax=Maioricimonas rarisocia TaxID=2528026 RepID=A0A517Z785_9PLAN|nr:hypothetical protein Mal4_26570 [Maioricimonas rarisocia]